MAARPGPFSAYTADVLWTDPHIAEQMLAFHLDGLVDVSSRRTETIEASVAWISATFSLGPGVSVLDLGCGPGLYTNRWAATGAAVTGVDFSPRSIAHARGEAARRGLTVDHVQADYLAYRPTTQAFDLVTMIMLDFCALSPDRRAGLLSSIATWLAPNGAFLFDVCSLAFLAARHETARYAVHGDGGFWSARPHFEFTHTFVYPTERVVLDKHTVIERHRTWTVYDWLQCFDVDSLSAEVERAGLQVEAVLGDVAGSPFDPAAPEFAVIARRAPG